VIIELFLMQEMSGKTCLTRLRSVFLLVFYSMLVGCSARPNREDVVGVYEALDHGNRETLRFNADGTYIQRFESSGAKELISSNKWEFEPYGGEPKVAVFDFSSHFPGRTHKIADSSISLLGVEKSWRGIRLYLSYDSDLYYKKVGD